MHTSGLPDAINDQDLLNAFKERYPSASFAKVITRGYQTAEGTSPRVFGFVHFKNRDDHMRCLAEAKQSPVTIHGQEIRVDSATQRTRFNHGNGYQNRPRRPSQPSSTYGSVGERTPIASPSLGSFDPCMEQVPHHVQRNQTPQPSMQQRPILPQPQSPYQPTYPYHAENLQVLGYPHYVYSPQGAAYYMEQGQPQFVPVDQNGYPLGMIPHVVPVCIKSFVKVINSFPATGNGRSTVLCD